MPTKAKNKSNSPNLTTRFLHKTVNNKLELKGMHMSFSNVHNYYEKLVFSRVLHLMGKKTVDMDYLEDIACVALNHLPPRYIRFDVDMIFYLSPSERGEMEQKIDEAIETAVASISKEKVAGRSKKKQA